MKKQCILLRVEMGTACSILYKHQDSHSLAEEISAPKRGCLCVSESGEKLISFSLDVEALERPVGCFYSPCNCIAHYYCPPRVVLDCE